MKLFRFASIILIASAAALTGCLERNFIEEGGVMSVNAKEIVVPADSIGGQNLVKDTIWVTSNRSWSAYLADDVNWVKLDTTGHHDMARISEVTPLALAFKDNETAAERSVDVVITCAEGSRTVKVRQQAIRPRLILTSSTDGFGSVVCDGEKLSISFNTNTDWTASVSPKSSAKVALSKTSGKYTSTITATVAENTSWDPLSAMVIISAPGCQDIEIPIGQLQWSAYFELPEGNEFEAEEGINDFSIPFKSNVSWTAEVVAAPGYPAGLVSVAASGTRSDKGVAVTFPYTIDFDNPATITVKITPDEMETPIMVTISQKPAIRIQWYDFANAKLLGGSASTCPVQNPPFEDITSSGTTVPDKYKGVEFDMVLKNGVTFKVLSTSGIYRNSSTGLMICNAADNYLKLPAVPGHKLTAIHYVWGIAYTTNTSGKLRIEVQDPDGNLVEGGKLEATPRASGEGSSPVDVTLTGTENGVSYTLVNKCGYNFGIGDLILYYE